VLKVVNQEAGDKQCCLLNYFLKNMYVFRKKSFIFLFSKRIYPLPLKMEELASNTCSAFFASGIHSADHLLAAVGCTGKSFC